MFSVAYDYKTTLIRNGVDASEIDDCMVWALGKNYSIIPIHEIRGVWNEAHGDIHTIQGSDLVIDLWAAIAKAYLKRGKHDKET